jgi:Arc/MetJ-type ribon-helix-helix transcriptional regulator
MAVNERITVRLPSDKLDLLQSLIGSDGYDNLSDVVREAVEEFIANRFTPENIEKITVDIPKGNVLELESLIRNGDSVSMYDAIRNAVREYTRARVKDQ